jgi:hypothetical protein
MTSEKHESPRRGLRATGTGPQHRSLPWPPPEGGWRKTSEIGDRTSDADVRALGFEPARRGWIPKTDVVRARVEAADARRRYAGPETFGIPGGPVECTVCGCAAEPSTVATPTCGGVCTAVLMHQLLATIGSDLYTRGDGGGGRAPVRPKPKRPRPTPRPIRGSASVARALERLGSVRDVLERHGVDVRWGRTARCPFHDDEHPSMSLYERAGKSRAHCYPCSWDGDVLDLEAALAGEEVVTTIRRWGGD